MRPGIVAIVLLGCGSAATPSQAPQPTVSASAVASAAPARDAGAPAPAPAVEEPALAWGTRPNREGPLFPIIDGMCIHAEAWTIDNAAFVTWGNPTEPNFSAGGSVNFYRLTDDGLDTDVIKSVDPKHRFGGYMSPKAIAGRWPGPLVLFDNGGPTRLGDGTATVWSHDDAGWKQVASHEDLKRTDVANPTYEAATLFKGHTVYARLDYKTQVFGPYPVHFKADPPLEGLSALDHESDGDVRLAATDDALYSLVVANNAATIREWKDGKARNIPLPSSFKLAYHEPHVALTKPLVLSNTSSIAIYRDGKVQVVEPKLAPSMKLTTVSAAPNGDLWLAETTHSTIFVVHPDGSTDPKPIPSPAVKRPNDLNSQHAAMNGGGIAGVEFDDPYAVGDAGTLFHLENGTWNPVPLPPAPWSTNTYRVESILMAAKGDLLVNAAYGVKEAGWTIGERNRAILRTKRPKEVLRCNEPRPDKGGYDGGVGLMSFPPFADDSCKTPFVVILRTTYKVHDKEPYVAMDPKSQFPSVRAVAPDLELVELTSGDQRYLGASVPTVAAGRDLLANLKKKVVIAPGLKPELVCGTPSDSSISRRLSPRASAEAGSTRH